MDLIAATAERIIDCKSTDIPSSWHINSMLNVCSCSRWNKHFEYEFKLNWSTLNNSRNTVRILEHILLLLKPTVLLLNPLFSYWTYCSPTITHCSPTGHTVLLLNALFYWTHTSPILTHCSTERTDLLLNTLFSYWTHGFRTGTRPFSYWTHSSSTEPTLRKKRGTYWLSRLSPASTESTCLCNFPFSMFWINRV